MKGIMKDASILFAITLIAGVCLGAVHEVTKAPIAAAQLAAATATYKEVYPDAASFEETDDLKIIDYEYASMNDPYVDLGLISAVNYFTEDMDVEMMKIYGGGKVDERAFARMKLNKIACDIKWAYWALYQAASSNVEFDYMNWYGQKMARLQHFWLDSRLDYWLDVAREKSTRIS